MCPRYASLPSAMRRTLSKMANTSELGWWMVHTMDLPCRVSDLLGYPKT